MYTDPNYRGMDPINRSVISLQEEDKTYQETLNSADEIRKKRDTLIDKRGRINPEDLAKLEQLLPDNVDNIKLVIDINQIAQNHGLVLKNIKLNSIKEADADSTLGQVVSKYGTVGLSFLINSSYDNFQNFLTDLEKSLRLVEITELNVTGNDTGLYDFSVNLKTYWLK